MKTTRVIAWILAWFNLIFWGIPVISSLIQSLASPNPLILVILVFFAAIPLNSFAALQLHRSIRNPQVKLNHQTPVGIRFVGTFALCVGGIIAVSGIIITQSAKDLLPVWKEQMAQYKQPESMATVGGLQDMGILMVVLGLAAIVNVVLNMRLLRWYYLVNRSDVS
ncbi:MAG TPA: hypothetical protein VG605_20950 [Puia sp.]|jgi:hypothetical protein|nr:hypothetical protein [Puia sp.]